MCDDTDVGPVCGCHQKYALHSDSKTCIDLCSVAPRKCRPEFHDDDGDYFLSGA